MKDNAIRIQDMTKVVEGMEIFSHFDFFVRRGEKIFVYASLTKGKTLLFKIILGLIKPDSGKVEVLNVDPYKVNIRKSIGFFTMPPLLVENRSVFLNMKMVLESLGKKNDIDMYLEIFGLQKIKNRKVKHLSFREKILLCIVREIVKMPEILILDDPFPFMSDYEINKLFSFLQNTDITFIAGTTRYDLKKEKIDFREVNL